MIPIRTVTLLKKAFTGDASSTALVDEHDSSAVGGPAIEAGGRIDLGTATTALVTVVDAIGKVLYNGTVTSDTDVDPVPMGVKCPLYATIASSNGSVTVYWSVKK